MTTSTTNPSLPTPPSTLTPPTPSSTTGPAATALTPREFGVGARLTLCVMADDYADVILTALRTAEPRGVDIEIGDVSTFVGGAEDDVLRYVLAVIAAACTGGRHVSATVHLSRGCPGEVACTLPTGHAGPRTSPLPTLTPTGIPATAEWALYPLGVSGHDDDPGHMRQIHAAIDLARANGTFEASRHFVTRLSGDLADVLETAAAGWVLVGRDVQHVTSHVTLSVNSPTAR